MYQLPSPLLAATGVLKPWPFVAYAYWTPSTVMIEGSGKFPRLVISPEGSRFANRDVLLKEVGAAVTNGIANAAPRMAAWTERESVGILRIESVVSLVLENWFKSHSSEMFWKIAGNVLERGSEYVCENVVLKCLMVDKRT